MLKPFTLFQRGSQTFREVQSIRQQLGLILREEEFGQERLSSGTVVVFLHGIMASGIVLNHLAEAVSKHSAASTLLFSYSRWTWTIDELTADFNSFLEEHVGADVDIILVGHSLGGMIARAFLQDYQDERVAGVITIATPHQGTMLGKTGMSWVRELFLPEGPVIKKLQEGEQSAQHIPHVCIAAELDQVITPRESATGLSWATHYWIENVGHNEMLYSPALEECLLTEIGRFLCSAEEN